MRSNGRWTVCHLAINQPWLHVCCLVLLQDAYRVTMSTAVVFMSGLPALQSELTCRPCLQSSAVVMVTRCALPVTMCSKVLMACR